MVVSVKDLLGVTVRRLLKLRSDIVREVVEWWFEHGLSGEIGKEKESIA